MDFSKLSETRGIILSRLELIDDLITVPSGFTQSIRIGYTKDDQPTFISLSAKHGLAYAIDEGYENKYLQLNEIPKHLRRLALNETINLLKSLEIWISKETDLNMQSILNADEYIKSLKKGQ